MRIDKEIKNKIAEEWINIFSQLSAFTQNKLYEIVGCCVLGIELIKLPHSEEYRPHFVIYALWKNDVKSCLDAPVLIKQLYNKKGLQFNIPYLKHNSYFSEAVECFKKQIPILLSNSINLRSLFELVDSRCNDILVKSNSAEQAKLFELKFYAALYTGDQIQVQNVLSQIQKESKNWNMQMFEIWYGKFELWFNRLRENVNIREPFLKQIEVNKQDKKIGQLMRLELTSV